MNKHVRSRGSALAPALGCAAACALLALAAGTPAWAQPTPAVPAGGPAAPPPAMPSYAHGEESISGRIVAFDGGHRLQLKDDRGFIDTVTLHDGTIINPTGLRLAPGQSVKIMGHTAGKTFEANEIDTPYQSYPGVAPYVYAPYGYAPYPYYAPYGPYYGYPNFSLGIGFGRGRFF